LPPIDRKIVTPNPPSVTRRNVWNEWN